MQNSSVTFDGGGIETQSGNNTSRYNFFVNGGSLTIKGGDFKITRTSNFYIYVAQGSTVKIEGGKFPVKPLANNADKDRYFVVEGSLTITGGEFGFDPTQWVADGYQAINENNTWTVSAVDSSEDVTE